MASPEYSQETWQEMLKDDDSTEDIFTEPVPSTINMNVMPMPLAPQPPVGSHKKVIYYVRHAEATHNVKEREAIKAVIATGEMDKKRHEQARRAVLQQDPSLKDAPLSEDGTEQARTSGKKLAALFKSSPPTPRRNRKTAAPFSRPDVVLVSPLRRALMTATELFYHQSEDDGSDPPMFLAIEALREKRTGLACDERSTVFELMAEFPHVDFSKYCISWWTSRFVCPAPMFLTHRVTDSVQVTCNVECQSSQWAKTMMLSALVLLNFSTCV